MCKDFDCSSKVNQARALYGQMWTGYMVSEVMKDQKRGIFFIYHMTHVKILKIQKKVYTYERENMVLQVSITNGKYIVRLGQPLKSKCLQNLSVVTGWLSAHLFGKLTENPEQQTRCMRLSELYNDEGGQFMWTSKLAFDSEYDRYFLFFL